MSPGEYLRRRREAAGLSIDNVAQLLVQPWGKLHLSVHYLAELERDRLRAEDATLDFIRKAFAFDPYIYRQLAAGLAIPTLCRICSCSWQDACCEGEFNCAWVPGEPDLCTACAAKAPASDAAAPAPSATISNLLIRGADAAPHA